MKGKDGYKAAKLSFNRRAVIASVSANEKNMIHSFAEVDISEPRRMIKEHFERTGEKLSFTAYIVKCFAHVLIDYPQFNSFIKGRHLILLDDIIISVLVEREINGESIPEPIGIKQAQLKSYRQIHNEIRNAKNQAGDKLGSLSGKTWIRFIPSFLFKLFVKIADKNIHMAKVYGKTAVTSVGMFCKEPMWFIPHGTATVLLTVGSINNKVVEINNQFVSKEHLCLTVSFNHFIIDGAPAARFMNQLIETIRCGKLLKI